METFFGSWTNPDSTVWLVVDRFAIVLSFAIVGTLATYGFRLLHDIRRARRRQELDAELATGRTAKPVALAVSFRNADIQRDVRRFLEARFPGASFPELPLGAADPDPSPKRFPIVEFRHGGNLTPGTVDADLARLRGVRRWLEEEGFTEVHLFLNTTVAFGCVIGSLFTNWGRVHLYHWCTESGSYEYWLPLAEVKRVADAPDLSATVAAYLAQRTAAARSPATAVPPAP
jgi:hypothetical protein